MKTKNPNQQVKIKNTADIKSVKNLSQVIPFYITIVSLTAIFALLTIFLLEKNETLKCVKSGLVQKIDNGKVIWTKP
jgi:F0F1-type ATP synthase membrane subunit a